MSEEQLLLTSTLFHFVTSWSCFVFFFFKSAGRFKHEAAASKPPKQTFETFLYGMNATGETLWSYTMLRWSQKVDIYPQGDFFLLLN